MDLDDLLDEVQATPTYTKPQKTSAQIDDDLDDWGVLPSKP